MSGLEVLSAIANVIAVVEVSQKILSRAAELQATGQGLGGTLLSIRNILPSIAHELKRIKKRFDDGEIDQETINAQLPVHEGAERTLTQLKTLLEKLTPEIDARKHVKYYKITKGVIQEKKIQEIQQALLNYVGVLNLCISGNSADLLLKATSRLALADVSSLGSQADDRRYYEVPRKLVRRFVGRDDILLIISQAFTVPRTSAPQVLILYALGGQGKSQVALKFCEMSKEVYQSTFWINASSLTTLTESFEGVAAAIDPTFLGGADKKMKHVLGLLECWKTRTLLVFDNYDSPQEFDIREYFPQSSLCDIIVTSRNQDLNRYGECHEISAMTGDAGLELLLPDAKVREEFKLEGDMIVNRLGGLALAIDQSAAYIAKRNIAIGDFFSKFDEEREELMKYIPEFGWQYTSPEGRNRERNRSLSAFTTWNMSFTQIYPEDPRKLTFTLRFLTLCAFLDSSNISEYLIRTYWQESKSRPEWLSIFIDNNNTENTSPITPSLEQSKSLSTHDDTTRKVPKSKSKKLNFWKNWRSKPIVQLEVDLKEAHTAEQSSSGRWSSTKYQDLIAKCRQLSLLRFQDDGDSSGNIRTVGFHPLIRDWLQLQVKTNGRATYIKEAFEIVLGFICSSEYRNDTANRRSLVGHMDAFIANDKSYLLHDYVAADTFASAYFDRGRWKDAALWREHAIEAGSKVLGPEHLSILQYTEDLALSDRDLNRIKEAENLLLQVIAVRKRVQGSEHMDTLMSMGRLATVYKHQEREKEAKDLGLQTLNAMERTHGGIDAMSADLISHLKYLFFDENNPRENESSQLQALAAQKIAYGLQHQFTINSMSRLASMYVDQQRWEEAEGLESQVLVATNQLYDLNHPDTLCCMVKVALLYLMQQRYEEAVRLGSQVLEKQKKVLGLEHPDTLRSIQHLAVAYSGQGRWKESVILKVELLETQRRLLGSEHPDTLTAMHYLAFTYSKLERWKEAENLQVESLKLRRRVLGLEHLDTLRSIQHLSDTYSEQERWKEAEILQEELLETRRRVLGLDHLDTLKAMWTLSCTYAIQDQWKEAEKLQGELLDTRRRILGLEHPDTLDSMHELACIYWYQDKKRDAVDLLTSCLEESKVTLGEEHADSEWRVVTLAKWETELKEEEETQHFIDTLFV